MSSYILKDPYSTDYQKAQFLYRARAHQEASKLDSVGKYLAYTVFGPDLIGSLAVALDPLGPYRFPMAKITPANRTRKEVGVPQSAIFCQHEAVTTTTATVPDLTTTFAGDRLIQTTSGSSGKVTTINTIQSPIIDVCSDTTRRTRSISSDLGTFNSFRVKTWSTGGSHSWHDLIQRVYSGGSSPDWAFSSRLLSVEFRGLRSVVSPVAIDSFKAAENLYADTLISKNYLGMLLQASPTRKKFDIPYNLYELRELPMMLKSSVEFYKSLTNRNGTLISPKKAGEGYLNVKFGWEQLVRTIDDMLSLPERIAEKVNYLLRRRGLATTYRAKREFLESPVSSLPALTFMVDPFETQLTSGTVSARRKAELRLVVNMTLDFPQIDTPRLREELLRRLWGTDPDPGTVYNAVPWTWLVDWFSDLGNYVDLINIVNADQNLVNWGLITYQSDGYVYKAPVVRESTRVWERILGVTTYDVTSTRDVVLPCGFDYAHTVRKDLSTLGGSLKFTSKLSTLSGDQLAIVGALLAQRS